LIRPVHIRHIKDGTETELGAVAVLDRYMVPQDASGPNGTLGFQDGQNDRRLNEESTFTLTFPNADGSDGVPHIDRFLILSTRDDYQLGDEWIEVYEGDQPGGDLIACGSPSQATASQTTIALTCVDAYFLQKLVRETSGGMYWCAAPRDVFDHYTQAWTNGFATDFSDPTTYSFSIHPQTTAAGVTYQQITPGEGQVRLLGTDTGGFLTIPTEPVGYVAGRGEHVRLETSIIASKISADGYIELSLGDGADRASMRLAGGGDVTITGRGGSPRTVRQTTDIVALGGYTLALELRERWVYFYIDEALVGVTSVWAGDPDTANAQLLLLSESNPDDFADVAYLILRRTRPWLLRGSDLGAYRLPGAPTPGGLMGSYFAEDPTLDSDDAMVLSPMNKPYMRRLDAALSFDATAALPNTWQPAGTPQGEHFSARWTGAVYLDDPSAYQFRARATDRVRVWIGKTLLGDQIIDDWGSGHTTMTTTASVEMPLADFGNEPGWYPIVVEYSNVNGVGGLIVESNKNRLMYPGLTLFPDDDIFPGPEWTTLGAVGGLPLAPEGIYEDQVRADSHYNVLKSLADTFGLQFTSEPMSLESGEFPCRLAPRVRVGRDYNKVITDRDIGPTDDEATSIQLTVNAEQSVSTIQADAQGVADQNLSAQLTAEVIDFGRLSSHLFIHSDQEQAADVSIPALLHQRLNSLLALRSSPWEEVGAVVAGRRELLDSFPLTGELAEIAWQPGDGVIRKLHSIRVEDTTPVQMVAVQQGFRPDGAGVPQPSFRQRPRSFREYLRRLQKQVLDAQRNYQGTMSRDTGSWGSTANADAYSRVPLPTDVTNVTKAEIVVLAVSGATTFSLEVNGIIRYTGLLTVGRYDILPWVARPNGVDPRMFARAIVTAGPGPVEIQLQITEAL
jgi:hypothetical protein